MPLQKNPNDLATGGLNYGIVIRRLAHPEIYFITFICGIFDAQWLEMYSQSDVCAKFQGKVKRVDDVSPRDVLRFTHTLPAPDQPVVMYLDEYHFNHYTHLASQHLMDNDPLAYMQWFEWVDECIDEHVTCVVPLGTYQDMQSQYPKMRGTNLVYEPHASLALSDFEDLQALTPGASSSSAHGPATLVPLGQVASSIHMHDSTHMIAAPLSTVDEDALAVGEAVADVLDEYELFGDIAPAAGDEAVGNIAAAAGDTAAGEPYVCAPLTVPLPCVSAEPCEEPEPVGDDNARKKKKKKTRGRHDKREPCEEP